MLLMSYGARNKRDELPIDVALAEEIKQDIRDKPRRRMDHGHKRATEQDRHPNAVAATGIQQEEDEEMEEKVKGEDIRSSKRQRQEEGKVAEEVEESEPSSNKVDDD